MAWALVSTGDAMMGLRANGSLEWNMALQAVLGDPKWVDVLWDSDERYLGLRCNYVTEGFPVHCQPDEGTFKVDSADILDDAGISVDSGYKAVVVRTDEPVLGSDGALYNPEPVWYITLP